MLVPLGIWLVGTLSPAIASTERFPRFVAASVPLRFESAESGLVLDSAVTGEAMWAQSVDLRSGLRRRVPTGKI